ncbi:restriction endonuclease subunit S [Gracilimonas sp. BCB1]|uniref:restriction endonuclease subunit S n=1 Tax=Gracilimonas sp. BCB1 TaxID=3152362 RepID=UPI0032D94AE6
MKDLRFSAPEKWSEEKLNSVIDNLSAGISVNSGDRPANKDEIAVLKTSSLNKGRFISKENKVIIDDEERERAKKNPIAGSILISRMNTPDLVGEIAYVEKDYPNLFLPDRIWITEGINHDKVNMKWLSYKLTSPEVRHNLKSIATGTSGSMKNITQKDFLKLPITFPPKVIQNKIVDIVENWDEAITKTEKLIQAKKRHKKGLMQRLLSGKVRFPEFEGEDWVEVKLGSLFKEVKRMDEWDDDKLYELISVRRRSGGIFHRENLYGREIKTKKLKKVKTGDFLISRMQIVHGASAVVTPEFEDLYVSNSYHTLVKKKDVELDMTFFDYISQLPYFYHLSYISSYGVHIEKMTFNLKDFLKKEIRIPRSQEEQSNIAELLSKVDKEISLLSKKKKKYQKQKQGLMQKLLTGKVRVNNLEVA